MTSLYGVDSTFRSIFTPLDGSLGEHFHYSVSGHIHYDVEKMCKIHVRHT